MGYIPHTDSEREAMLRVIGVKSVDELFSDVPARHRFPKLDLPEALSEMDAVAELRDLSEANVEAGHAACFLGAGAYNHFIPAAINHMLMRGEFYTAYTPYQPEISQGTLQAIFEYQSLIANLTGMEVANASLYDGATALAEAVSMALSHHRGKRRKIVFSPAIHPYYRQVARTYLGGMDVTIAGDETVANGLQALTGLIDEDTALVAVQYPDFFGRIEDFTNLGRVAPAAGTSLC